MANPMRGEARLGAHKLTVDFNGWCTLERRTRLKVPELLAIAASEQGLGFDELRAWVSVFADLAEDDAGNAIGEFGHEASLLALTEAVDGFFGEKAKEAKENPPKAA